MTDVRWLEGPCALLRRPDDGVRDRHGIGEARKTFKLSILHQFRRNALGSLEIGNWPLIICLSRRFRHGLLVRKDFARPAYPRLAGANLNSCTLSCPTTACAAFIEESRMECADAAELRRKFGELGAPVWVRGELAFSSMLGRLTISFRAKAKPAPPHSSD
jgi:hypothetical protein